MFKKLMSWLKQIVLFLVLALIVSTIVDVWRGQDIPNENLPDIKGITLNGTEIDVALLSQEQAVLVYFWGTWCPVCSFVSPAVSTLSEHYPVVTIAMSSGVDDKLRQYLKHHDYQFEVLNDQRSQIAKHWSVQVTPTVFVFKNGEIKHYTTGFTSIFGLWWRMATS